MFLTVFRNQMVTFVTRLVTFHTFFENEASWCKSASKWTDFLIGKELDLRPSFLVDKMEDSGTGSVLDSVFPGLPWRTWSIIWCINSVALSDNLWLGTTPRQKPFALSGWSQTKTLAGGGWLVSWLTV